MHGHHLAKFIWIAILAALLALGIFYYKSSINQDSTAPEAVMEEGVL